MVQHETIAKEIRDLEKNKIHSKSLILDSEGLIRIGDRLRNAELSETQKHLPPKHFITNLTMEDEHLRLHHCPPTQLLNSVRHKFWPLSSLREAHKAIKANVLSLSSSFSRGKNGRLTGTARLWVRATVRYNGHQLCRPATNFWKSTTWEDQYLKGLRCSLYVLCISSW